MIDLECLWPEKEREMRRINSDIEKQIKREKTLARCTYKILFLGTGEAGKSTFIRHMQLLHGDGFTQRELKAAKQIILKNLDDCVLAALRIIKHNADSTEETSELDKNFELDTLLPSNIRGVILNERVREVFTSTNLYTFPDSANYFISESERVLAEDYIPTNEDVLRMRQATTGINEISLSFGTVRFRLVDVGGQRSERRKWIHCFQDVSAIIFLASLAEYNMSLVEDPSMNRLDESLLLFVTLLSNPWIKKGAMILFLNKKDIFQDKIRLFPLKKTFPKYQGLPGDHIEAREFIADKFLTAGEGLRSTIYSHITCATDPENVSFVFDAVKHVILSKIMNELFSQSVYQDNLL